MAKILAKNRETLLRLMFEFLEESPEGITAAALYERYAQSVKGTLAFDGADSVCELLEQFENNGTLRCLPGGHYVLVVKQAG